DAAAQALACQSGIMISPQLLVTFAAELHSVSRDTENWQPLVQRTATLLQQTTTTVEEWQQVMIGAAIVLMELANRLGDAKPAAAAPDNVVPLQRTPPASVEDNPKGPLSPVPPDQE